MLSEFCNFLENILIFDPDVVILDWCETSSGKKSGEDVLKAIWKNGYRQIIIFSGRQELIDIATELEKSTLLKSFPKGSEDPVIEYLDKNELYINVLTQYRNEVGNALIEAFNVIKPIQDGYKDYIGDAPIKYLLARRTVDYFDREKENLKLPQWGMYIYPPVSTSLTVCDIIRKVKVPVDDMQTPAAENYRLILTPSCDMVSDDGREPKVKEIVCAKCFDKKLMISAFPQGTKRNKLKDKLSSALTSGAIRNWVALPKLEGVCPTMCTDMKQLEVVPIEDVAVNEAGSNEKTRFLRVAGISSPFREQIIWTYMQIACRPGVPDRNFPSWVDEILED